MTDSDKPWTPEEAASWFSVSEVTIRRWVREGKLRRIPTGGALRITALSVSRLTHGEYDVEHGESQRTRDDLGDRPVEGEPALAGGRDDGRRPPRVAHRAQPQRGREAAPGTRRGAGAGPRPDAPDARGLPPRVGEALG